MLWNNNKMQEEKLISILQDVALGTLTVIEAKEVIIELFGKKTSDNKLTDEQKMIISKYKL